MIDIGYTARYLMWEVGSGWYSVSPFGATCDPISPPHSRIVAVRGTSAGKVGMFGAYRLVYLEEPEPIHDWFPLDTYAGDCPLSRFPRALTRASPETRKKEDNLIIQALRRTGRMQGILHDKPELHRTIRSLLLKARRTYGTRWAQEGHYDWLLALWGANAAWWGVNDRDVAAALNLGIIALQRAFPEGALNISNTGGIARQLRDIIKSMLGIVPTWTEGRKRVLETLDKIAMGIETRVLVSLLVSRQDFGDTVEDLMTMARLTSRLSAKTKKGVPGEPDTPSL